MPRKLLLWGICLRLVLFFNYWWRFELSVLCPYD
ncbi:unnamed protein product [Onchocerca flexuosa]|uniref:Uncharacterized protein n=1 Tax=Onchocerca flexuosa TaxID=387005 RepID=A0A183GZ24_9BILA|nr:unnamed protein product [Onchocerca flexuosa]